MENFTENQKIKIWELLDKSYQVITNGRFITSKNERKVYWELIELLFKKETTVKKLKEQSILEKVYILEDMVLDCSIKYERLGD